MIYSKLKEKNYQLKIYSKAVLLNLRRDQELFKQTKAEGVHPRMALQEMLKGVLQAEMKAYQLVTGKYKV